MQRRLFIKAILLLLVPVKVFSFGVMDGLSKMGSNFKSVYTNNKLKNEFYKFLKNVFNLFPEEDLHKLIAETTKQKSNDKEVYLEAQSRLGSITPFFSIFSHQLPALFKQKDEMASQTVEL